MKSVTAAATALVLATPLLALDGDPARQDPSTIVVHDGKSYAYGTGGGLPIHICDDGWTWRRGGSLMQVLPDRLSEVGKAGVGAYGDDRNHRRDEELVRPVVFDRHLSVHRG